MDRLHRVTEAVAVDYSEQAADTLLAAAVDDPRCEPDFFEASVRALLAGWLATVDAETGSGAVAVRDARLWLVFVTGPTDEPGLSLNAYVAGRRWHRGEPEPADDSSLADAEHWNFVQTWPMLLPDEGPWQLGVGTTQTLEQVTGYRFVSRRETTEEYEARTGARSVPPQPPTRRFLLVASMVDDAAYTGGAASTIVARPSPPSRLETEELLQPAMQAELRRTSGEAEYQPTVTALASYELLD